MGTTKRLIRLFYILLGTAIPALTVYSQQPVPAQGATGEAHSDALQADKPRSLRSRDNLLSSAQRSAQLADRLRSTWKASTLREAITRYREARNYSRRAGDLRGEAVAALGVADVFFHLSENRKAQRAYTDALGISQKAHDTALQIRALNGISYVLIDLGRLEESLRYSTRARALSEQTGDRLGLAASLNSIGLQHYSTGNIPQALPLLERALSVFQETGDRRGEAETLTNLGYTRQDFGDPARALEVFERSLAVATEIDDQRIQALDLTAIGLVNSVLGEQQKALEFHNRALAIFRRMGNRSGEAVVNNGIGSVYSDIGDNQGALRSHLRAFRLFREIGQRDFEGLTMGLIGNVHLSIGDPRKALIWCKRRLALCREVKSHWVASHTLNDIGSVYDFMGQTRIALGYFNEALAEAHKLGDRRGQAYSLNSIGSAKEKLGKRVDALADYRKALALFREVAHGVGEMQALHNIARAERNIGNLKQALETARSLIEMVEARRFKVAGAGFRASYFASVHEHYQLYIDVLMRMHLVAPSAGYEAAALDASEKARSRSLVDMLREARADIREGVSPELLERERSLQSALNAKAGSLTMFIENKLGRADVDSLKKEISVLAAEYDLVEAQIRANSPRYAALTRPQVPDLSMIQKQVLDPDTLLLEYSLGKGRSYVWAVTQESIEGHELPAEAKIEAVAREFYRSIASAGGKQRSRRRAHADSTRESTVARDLSRMILGPVAEKLKSKRRLGIVAPGLLQYVPFSALVDPGRSASGAGNALPLADSHEIVNLPSASVLFELRRGAGERPFAPKTIAVFADPVFSRYDERVFTAEVAQPSKERTNRRGRGGSPLEDLSNEAPPVHFPRLAFTEQEADEITRLVPLGDFRLFLDFDASKSSALDGRMAQYRILHFATHAVLDNAHAGLSSIVLSLMDKEGRAQDGFVRLNDIYNMKLAADLVVLSACKTALGKPVEGEGLLGLTRGFMYAGASRVVASLWEVDDHATKEFMKHFYEGILVRALTPAAALREAQSAIRSKEQWRSPYYWAGFVLQGDWR